MAQKIIDENDNCKCSYCLSEVDYHDQFCQTCGQWFTTIQRQRPTPTHNIFDRRSFFENTNETECIVRKIAKSDAKSFIVAQLDFEGREFEQFTYYAFLARKHPNIIKGARIKIIESQLDSKKLIPGKVYYNPGGMSHLELQEILYIGIDGLNSFSLF